MNKFCSYCGKELQVGVKFCPYCGRETMNSVDKSTDEKKKKLSVAVIAALLLVGGAFLGGVPQYISSSISQWREQQVKELLNEANGIYKDEMAAQKLAYDEYGKWTGSFEKCEKLLVSALDKAETAEQKLTIRNKKMLLYHSGGNKDKAVAEAKAVLSIFDGAKENLPKSYYRIIALEEIIRSAHGEEKYNAAMTLADYLLKTSKSEDVSAFGQSSIRGLIGGCLLPIFVHKDSKHQHLILPAAKKAVDLLDRCEFNPFMGEKDPNVKRYGLIICIVGSVVSDNNDDKDFWKEKLDYYNSRESYFNAMDFLGNAETLYDKYNDDGKPWLEKKNSKEPYRLLLKEIDKIQREMMN